MNSERKEWPASTEGGMAQNGNRTFFLVFVETALGKQDEGGSYNWACGEARTLKGQTEEKADVDSIVALERYIWEGANLGRRVKRSVGKKGKGLTRRRR